MLNALFLLSTGIAVSDELDQVDFSDIFKKKENPHKHAAISMEIVVSVVPLQPHQIKVTL